MDWLFLWNFIAVVAVITSVGLFADTLKNKERYKKEYQAGFIDAQDKVMNVIDIVEYRIMKGDYKDFSQLAVTNDIAVMTSEIISQHGLRGLISSNKRQQEYLKKHPEERNMF